MEDGKILDLYWDRDQRAISETSAKYGGMCTVIAENILANRPDAEECVNDTYLVLWNSIPPQRPSVFSAFTAKITRYLAIKRLKFIYAQKRSINLSVSISELDGCVPSYQIEDGVIDKEVLSEIIEKFILSLSEQNQYIFLRRYFFFVPVSVIAKTLLVSENTVKSSLLRSRRKLKVVLEKEGIFTEKEKEKQR
ncbi:MAG: sigma-70 family RNA polymerase sigma factor [Clostridia bacterium]|nr:sigma-70 family RNA polymerase sigma factor [Clostridia bacterium]